MESTESEAFISILAVNIDFVQVKVLVDSELSSHPSTLLRPVVRVFGSTDTGQRACLHIHGVSPYVYFRPEANNHPSFESLPKLARILPILEKSLDELLGARRKNPGSGDSLQSNFLSKRKRISSLEIVSKKSIYGMWLEPMLFVKANLYDPQDVSRLATILDEGALAGIQMQTYESHIPYLMQFTSSYNVAPMGWIHLKRVKFRAPLPNHVLEMGTTVADPTANDQPNPTCASSTLKTPGNSQLSSSSSQTNSIFRNRSSHTPQREYLCEANISERDVWFSCPTTDAAVNAPITAESEPSLPIPPTEEDEEVRRAVAEVLEGITEDQLIWSQLPATNAPSQPIESSTKPPIVNIVNPVQKLLQKMSTCELEFDTHESCIINASMPKKEFGSELWDEERLRCKSKGLEMDKAPTPPSTQTIHRNKSENESEFQESFGFLQAKGLALRQQAKQTYKRITSSKLSSKKKQVDAEFIMSLFLPSSEGEKEEFIDDMHGPLESNNVAMEFNSDSWAEDTLKETIEDAVLQEEMLESYLQDSHSIVAEYNRTQSSQPIRTAEEIARETTPASSATKGSGASDNQVDDEDDEEGLVGSQREVNDILSSTQYDAHSDDGGVEKSKRDRKSAAPNMTEDNFVGERVVFIDSPLPVLPPKPKQLFRSDSIGESDRNDLFNDSIEITEAKKGNKTSDPSLPLSGRKDILRRPDSANRLTSVFKKRKFETPSPLSSQVVQVPTAGSIGGDATILSTPPQAEKNVQPLPSALKRLNAKKKSVSFAGTSLIGPSESTTSLVHEGIAANALDGAWPTDVLSPPSQTEQVNQSPNILLSDSPLRRNPSPKKSPSKTVNWSDRQSATLLVRDGNSMQQELASGGKTQRLVPTFDPPSRDHVSLMGLNEGDALLPVVNRTAFYSSERDALQAKASLQSAASGGGYAAYMAQHHLEVRHERDVDAFDGGYPRSMLPFSSIDVLSSRNMRCLIPTFAPPKLSRNDDFDDMPSRLTTSNSKTITNISMNKDTKPASWTKSQICTPTQTPASSLASPTVTKQRHQLGMANKSSEKMTRLIVLSMEVFSCTRKELLPNPKYDAVQMLCWCASDTMTSAEAEEVHRFHGIIVWPPAHLRYHKSTAQCSVSTNPTGVDEATARNAAAEMHAKEQWRKEMVSWQNNLRSSTSLPSDLQIQIVESEDVLYETFFSIVREIDPDFLMGYESQNTSFGYFIRRGAVIGLDATKLLSRLPTEKPSYRNSIVQQQQQQQEQQEQPEQQYRSREGEEDLVEDGDPGIFIKGRTFLNTWQLMKAELKLQNNSCQHVAEQVLHCSVPTFSCAQLTRWFQVPRLRYKTVQHLYLLTHLNLRLLEQLDLVRKISESARLYGIDFYSVIHRGSQYRVEAALLIKARSMGYLLLSPSRVKVASQAPMEVIPLVLEPKSRFYHDPVLVLDFQSLYPSMMIAHNLCFSTCLGKLRPGAHKTHHKCNTSNTTFGDSTEEQLHPNPHRPQQQSDTTGRLGVLSSYPERISAINAVHHLRHSADSIYTQPSSLVQEASPPSGNESLLNATKSNDNSSKGLVDSHPDRPYVSPNGSIFCAPGVRTGILPMMLREMLNTRVMVKRAMKRHQQSHTSSSVLHKVLDARQLAIKLLSNVTYGYTAAGFSGRMPMAELADAIVSSGRSLLEWTMRFITDHPTWRGEVVYGDTDSIFVHLPGRTLAQAFTIGEEIARVITSKTPPDVVLKFEKVYFPCILVTKKRYVGHCFESLTQEGGGTLDAKGIEVVRRDQCPAAMKIQEKVLRLLFSSRDMSLVRGYLEAQWKKMLVGGDTQVLLRDFIFCKEVRFGHYASIASQPPGAIVATKAVLSDPMAVPPYNWRVPYVVVHGLPNAPLKHLVFDPQEVLRRGGGTQLRLNFIYYITKCINPALDRVLSLCGVSVHAWYKNLVRPRPRTRHINYDLFDDPTSTDASHDEQVQFIDMTVPSDGYAGTLQASSISGNGSRFRSSNQANNKRGGMSGVAPNTKANHQMTMDRFTTQATCEICDKDALPQKNLCATCLHQQPMESMLLLTQRLQGAQALNHQLSMICHACAGCPQPASLFQRGSMIDVDACQTLTCATFHERVRLVRRIEDYTLATRDVLQQHTDHSHLLLR